MLEPEWVYFAILVEKGAFRAGNWKQREEIQDIDISGTNDGTG